MGACCSKDQPLTDQPLTVEAGPQVAIRGYTEMSFPMCVVPIDKFLTMETLMVYEECEKEGILVQWQPHMKKVVFASHSWLDWKHPDPDAKKLKFLQRMLRLMLEGKVEVEGWWTGALLHGLKGVTKDQLKDGLAGGFVWFDWTSVPQSHKENQKKAVESIYHYVQKSAFFMVVAPTVEHKGDGELRDVRSWASRGWCRVERIANELSLTPVPTIVLQSPGNYYTTQARDWILNPVGKATFTIDADRITLGPVLNQLAENRIAHASREGDLPTARMLRACKSMILEGTEFRLPTDEPYGSWMEKMQFASPTDNEASGWSPLRYAMYAGRLDVARILVEKGADIECPLAEPSPMFAGHHHDKGCSILALVAWMRDFPDGVQFLLDAKADHLKGNVSQGETCLHSSSGGGHIGNFDILAKHDPDSLMALDVFHNSCLTNAVYNGHAKLVKHIMDKHGSTFKANPFGTNGQFNGYGVSMVSHAVLDVGDCDTLQATIGAGFDFNSSGEAENHSAFCGPQIKGCEDSMNKWLSETKDNETESLPSKFEEFFANLPKLPPISFASYWGNVKAVMCLIENQADINLQNKYGRTPLHFAAMGGHSENITLLQKAGAKAGISDAWGRKPADYARRRGFYAVTQALLET